MIIRFERICVNTEHAVQTRPTQLHAQWVRSGQRFDDFKNAERDPFLIEHVVQRGGFTVTTLMGHPFYTDTVLYGK